MSIPASLIVSLTSRTIADSASDLETNGMVLTKSALIPADNPAMTFTSASSVAALFGDEADETVFAQQYFTGLTNQQKAPGKLVIGRRIDEDAAAWVRGGAISATLAELKSVTDGVLTLTVNGEGKKATGIDLSGATSLSEIAQLVATAIGGVTGTYDSNTGMFTFTTEAKGSDATITYASDGTFAVGASEVGTALVSGDSETGTDLSELLCLTMAAGAVLSQGVNTMTASANLDAVCAVTANWSQFTTLWEVTEQDEAEAYSAWADIDDDYVYVFWSSDHNMCNQLTQANTIAYALKDAYNCTLMIYANNYTTAAFAIAYPATIKWDQTQGMKVIFGKAASGLEPTITDEASAMALDDLCVSYIGLFATRNDEFTFANRGALTGNMYLFYDVLIGMIWFKSKLQTSIMNGFASVNRVPYNDTGFTMIRAWCQDPIEQALNVGAIDAGISLSSSQETQILQETGDDTAAGDVETNGYYLQITDPGASVRAQRGSPTMYLLVAYAGSVQKIELPVTVAL